MPLKKKRKKKERKIGPKRWWLRTRLYIQEMTGKDCMRQEKKNEEDYACIEDCVDASIQGLEDCVKKSKERLIAAANNNSANTETKTTKITDKKREKNNCVDISSEIAH